MPQDWKAIHQLEQQAIKILGWTETRLASETFESITEALQKHNKEEMRKKKQLPVVCAPEPILELRDITPKIVEKNNEEETPEQEEEKVTPTQQLKKQIPSPQKPILDIIGKTPVLLVSATSPSIHEDPKQKSNALTKQIQQLQARRWQHEVLLANPAHMQDADRLMLEESLVRTVTHIRTTLKHVYAYYDELRTKRSIFQLQETEEESDCSTKQNLKEAVQILQDVLGLSSA